MISTKNRIEILDGFRALAILMVMLFHYFSRWIPPRNPVSLYPYNNQYNYFDYGYLGVQLFFIISGFVIFFTLENTNHFIDFWKKRIIRLLPSMIIATLITFAVFRLFDKSYLFPVSHSIRNFLPCLTFIWPNFFNQVFSPEIRFEYINGSYWSLWPEIQFYLFISIIFFLNKKNFIRNFLIISGILMFLNCLLSNSYSDRVMRIVLDERSRIFYSTWIDGIFNLLNYLPFFCMGVLFYLLFKNKQESIKTHLFIKVSLFLFMAFLIYSGTLWGERFIYAGFLILFFLFIYYPQAMKLFRNKKLTGIGESSYFLYLIHESIGVFLIYSLGQYFMPLGFIWPLLLIITLTLLSKLYTEKIDKKISIALKRIFLKR